MYNIYKTDITERETKDILDKLYNHNLKLVEELSYMNRLVDMFGNKIKRTHLAKNGFKRFSHMGYIYKIENSENHKKYIGQSVDVISRKENHMGLLYRKVHPNSCMQKDFIIYSPKVFTFEIVEQLEDDKYLTKREDYWMEYFNSYFPNGYNHPLKDSPEWKNRGECLQFMKSYRKKNNIRK